MSTTAAQRYLAEFLGTFGLLLSVTGAALLSLPSASVIDPLTRVVLISLAIGTGLTAMIYACGDLSGAHFNPAVTIGCWVAGRFRGRDVVPYIVAQLLGALLAVGIIAGVAHGSSTLWHIITSGGGLAAQGYSGNGSPYSYGWGSAFLLEVVLTFFLVTVILFATRGDNSSKNLAPLGIGLALLMINLVAIPVDGASVNPARSFAPAVLSVFWSPDRWAIDQDWLFWVAPIAGALIAAMVERFLRPSPA
jgi:aquaporin Z